MGRGRVQLQRIENKINRQVTFSKRRNGLLKKAHEISVLCDAEVAVIVFSNKGKVFDYSTDSCMEKILERYERYSYADRQMTTMETESHFQILQGNWTVEYSRLSAKIELLQRNRRQYLGEDLESLSQRDLQNLEQQLETSLKQVRTRKNQLMNETISELQRTVKNSAEQNNALLKKIKEKEKNVAVDQNQIQWEPQNLGPSTSSFMLPPSLPCLNIGGSYSNEGEAREQARRNDLELTLEPLYSCHLGHCFAE